MNTSLAVLVIFSIFAFCSGRTIQWTRAGGTNSWDFGANWDSQTVPSSTDDVIIDLTLIDGYVQVGASAAFCNSLTVGGTSGRTQTLQLYNALTVGTGGAKILPNGHMILSSSSASPLTSAGTFNGGSTFVFDSGALTTTGGGSFNFDYVLFNGSASKDLNGKLVAGTLEITPFGSMGVVNINKGQLAVTGTLKTSATVTISSAAGASLAVTGTLSFSGTSTDQFTIRGDAMITKLNAVSGTVIYNDNVTTTATVLGAGSTLSLIGAITTVRIFGDITGAGILQVSAGTNTASSFTNFGSVQLNGGTLVINTNPSLIANFAQQGGSLTGTAPVSITLCNLINGLITKATLNINNLNIKGGFSIDASTVVLTGQITIGTPSQFTLSNAVSLIISASGLVAQSSPFQLLRSSNDNTLTHNGKWTSTSDLQVLITTTGSGSFQLGNGSTTNINGVSFTTGSITFTGGSLAIVSSIVNAGYVSGSGTISLQGQSFSVSGNLQASSYSNTVGTTTVGSCAIQSLSIASGTFNITGASSTAGSVAFQGGVVSGAGSAKTTFVASSWTLTTNQFKNVEDIIVKTSALSLSCGSAPCQLQTTDATITTATQSGSMQLFEKKRDI